MHNVRLSSLSDCVVFFDFDNTITPFDVFDNIVKHFSTNKDWKVFESAWRRGEISSRECLESQLRSVRISKKGLLQYISRIKVDPYVPKVFNLLNREGIRPVVLSDSFSFIIKNILKNNGIKAAKVYANHLDFRRNRLVPSFPYGHQRCTSCAHCKKKNLLKRDVRDKIIIYVGDGLSDICPAECSDIVFAKGTLLQYFRRAKRLCLAFDSLKDIYNYFKGLEK